MNSLFMALVLLAIRPDCDIVGSDSTPAAQADAVEVQPFDTAAAIQRSINQGKKAANQGQVQQRVRIGVRIGLRRK